VVIGLVATSYWLVMSNAQVQNFMYNSDQLTLPSLAEDILRNPHFSLSTWMIPRAPYFFPDFIIYFALRVLTGDAYLAMSLHAGAHIVMLAAAAKVFIDRASLDVMKARVVFVVFLLLSAVTLVFSFSVWFWEIAIWPFISIAHATAVIAALFMFVLYERIAEGGSLVLRVVGLILSAALIFSDNLFALFFCAPYAAALLLFRWPDRSSMARLALFLGEMALALLIALGLAKLFVQQQMDPVQFRIMDHLRPMLAVIRNSGVGPWAWLAVGTAAAVVLVLRPERAGGAAPGREQAKSRRAQLFVATMTLVGLGVLVMLWREPSSGYARYGVGLHIGALICVACLAGRLIGRPSDRIASIATVSAVALLAVLVAWLTVPSDPTAPLLERRRTAAAFAACRDSLGLRSGFASYWLARRLTMATDWATQVNQFEPGNPRLFFWGSNMLWFYLDMTSGRPQIDNFIVENGFARQDIERRYGRPAKEADCGFAHVLVYDDPEALRGEALRTLPVFGRPQGMLSRLPAGVEPTEATLLLTEFGHQTGSVTKDEAWASERADLDGYLLFGPYLFLQPGAYSVEFSFSCEGNRHANIFDISAKAGGRIMGAEALQPGDARCNGAPQMVAMAFSLASPTIGVEFRTLFGGSGTLKVVQVKLKKQ
jgi:hypothetical protein